MEEPERKDLLVDDTVRSLRDVFLIDNAFPVQWEETPPPDPWYRRVRSWLGRSLGFSRVPQPSVSEDDAAANI